MINININTFTKKQKEAGLLMSSPAKYCLLYGGSRSGKSFIIIFRMIQRALKEPGSRHLIVRFAFNHAKQSLWHDTIPKCLKLCFPHVRPTLNKSDWFLEFENGSQIWLGGLDDKERTEKVLGNSSIRQNRLKEGLFLASSGESIPMPIPV